MHLLHKDKICGINIPCKENYKQVVIMGSLLHQKIIPKMILVNALSRIGYWYKMLILVYVYVLTLEVSNCSHKLKYEDTWAKHVGAWYWIQVHWTWPQWECRMVVYLSVQDNMLI